MTFHKVPREPDRVLKHRGARFSDAEYITFFRNTADIIFCRIGHGIIPAFVKGILLLRIVLYYFARSVSDRDLRVYVAKTSGLDFASGKLCRRRDRALQRIPVRQSQPDRLRLIDGAHFHRPDPVIAEPVLHRIFDRIVSASFRNKITVFTLH